MQAKALVAPALHTPFQLVDIQLDPSSLAEDEVIVQFKHTGICHTDLASWAGHLPAPFPCILGHEGAGVVVHVSPDYKGPFKQGDAVIASFCSCGDCGHCQSNRPATCDLFLATNLAFYTKHLTQVKIPYTTKEGNKAEAFGKYFGQSSFASHMAVTDRSLTKISPDISTHIACALACGFQTGFSTVLEKSPSLAPRSFELLVSLGASIPPSLMEARTSASRSTQTLLVTGMGAVGLGAIYAGKLLGYGKVIACDLYDARLETAKEAGATDVVNPRSLPDGNVETFVQRIKEISADSRGATLSVEASGSPVALRNITKSLATGGKVVILGTPPPGSALDVPYAEIPANVWTVEGVLMGDSVPQVTFGLLTDHVKSGKLKFLEKIIKIYTPDEMDKAVHDAESGQIIKPVIQW